MKKIIVLVLALVTLLGCLSGCAAKTVKSADNLDAYVKTLGYHDGFTILQLTDIHWNSGTQIGDGEYGCEQYLRKVIDEAAAHAGKIDLIEITGDTFMLANKIAVDSFIDFMEDVGIPYAITWGNHDRESTYNPNWISERFMEAEHSLYTEVDDDVHERCNYVVNLTDGDGKTVWQITHLDSGASARGTAADFFLDYDYIREDQLAWMKAEHDAAGADVPVICYYHIAQADNDLAYNAIAAGSTDYKSKFFKLEGFASSEKAPETAEFFKSVNVKAAFMGHAHANDWTFTTPDGIVYGLGVKTGTELYYGQAVKGYADAGFEVTEDFDISGASLVTLKDAAGTFDLEHLYLNERDGEDFVLWVNYND